jgi:hypothetical protein
MPASIAHMFIAHKAIRKLRDKGVREYTEFSEMLDDASEGKNYRAYVNLGSMGPDLYYHSSVLRSIKDVLTDGFVRAKAVTPWSYHLHSHRPNEFPLRLMEIIFSDAIRKKGKVELLENDIRKLAYVAGHLSHIAADQIVHPAVNSIAGPYFRSGSSRAKHRECEVFQDYFLYEEVYRLEEKSGPEYDFFKQNFRAWADCVKGPTTRNTEDWFRYFLQRGFMETYGMCPSESRIENSVDTLLLILWACKLLGPYRKAAREYREDRENSKLYGKYVKDIGYLRYYRLAVELTVIYLIALYEVYFVLKEGRNFTNRHKKRFLSIVSDADLGCPLKQKIYEKARAELRSDGQMEAALKKHSQKLLKKTRLVTRSRIFKAKSDRDIVTA